MEDPEAREPLLKLTGDDPLFVYQFQYPLGVMNGAVAKDMAALIAYLNDHGIEPFSIVRVGPLV